MNSKCACSELCTGEILRLSAVWCVRCLPEVSGLPPLMATFGTCVSLFVCVCVCGLLISADE